MAFEGVKRFFQESRADRLRSPEFQDAMRREKVEFSQLLGEAKEQSLELIYEQIIINVLLGIVKDEVKMVFQEKYSIGKSFAGVGR